MIDVRELSYTYPGKKDKTLKGINFTVPKGKIFGFLGPSGAGKSTLQKILIGLLPDFWGEVLVTYRDLNTFLWPSFLLMMPLSLPLLSYFGLMESPLFWIHPLYPPLLLLKGNFSFLALLIILGWALFLTLITHKRYDLLSHSYL